MKLIEKKCPNCGASLSFSDTDKSCKCEYCERSFEIERCNDNSSNLSDNFSLSEFKTPAKFISAYLIGSYISSIIVGIIVFCFIGLAAFCVFKGISAQMKDNDIFLGNKYFSNVSELSNDDYEEIDNKFEDTFNSSAMGENNIKHYYSQDGDVNNFKNPQIKAPEFYLNSDNSCYSYGYASLDEAYNNVVVPLEKDYKISKK